MTFGLKELLRDAASGSPDGGGSGAGDDKTPVTLKSVQELVDKSINGFVKRFEGEQKKTFGALESKLTDVLSRLDKGSQGGDDDGDGGDSDGGDKGGGKVRSDDKNVPPALKAQMDAQQRMIDKLNKRIETEAAERDKAQKRAEETERNAAIRAELQKYSIVPESVDDVYDLVKARVSRADDGTLIVGDTTMEAHIKSTLERNPGLLRPLEKGGAGSSAGQRTGKVDINDIKPGMSKETEAAALAEISKYLQGA